MKQYKSISIKVNSYDKLGDRLNEYAKQGWYLQSVITNAIPSGDEFEFIYLLERDVLSKDDIEYRNTDMPIQ